MRGPALLACGLALGIGHAWADCFTSSVPDLSAYPTRAEAIANAPIQSVNALTGIVTIPTYQRQVSSAVAVATADGTVSWTFPSAFTNNPTCFYSLFATTTTSTFDFPQVTAISKTAVSLVVSSHPKSLSIGGLSLPIVLTLTPAGVPAGTTITFSCFAPA